MRAEGPGQYTVAVMPGTMKTKRLPYLAASCGFIVALAILVLRVGGAFQGSSQQGTGAVAPVPDQVPARSDDPDLRSPVAGDKSNEAPVSVRAAEASQRILWTHPISIPRDMYTEIVPAGDALVTLRQGTVYCLDGEPMTERAKSGRS